MFFVIFWIILFTIFNYMSVENNTHLVTKDFFYGKFLIYLFKNHELC